MGEDVRAKIASALSLDTSIDLKAYSPLTLAYIGDAIYEIIIRTMLVSEGDSTVQKLHKKCTKYVNCAAQRAIIEKIEIQLTEEEIGVFHRGRNAKSFSMPRNATPADYRNATGFEALCGYLYLKGDMDRLLYLVAEGLKEA